MWGRKPNRATDVEAFQALRESVSGAELVTALELGSVPFVDLVSLRGAAERDASLVPAYQLALQAFQEIHGPQVGFWSYDEGDIAITERDAAGSPGWSALAPTPPFTSALEWINSSQS